MTTDDALDEASELRRRLVEQIRRNDELMRENVALRTIVASVMFDLDRDGRVSGSTEHALRFTNREGR